MFLVFLIQTLRKNLLTQWESEEKNKLDYLIKKKS